MWSQMADCRLVIPPLSAQELNAQDLALGKLSVFLSIPGTNQSITDEAHVPLAPGTSLVQLYSAFLL